MPCLAPQAAPDPPRAPQHKIQCCPFPDVLPRLHRVISPANPGQLLNHCLPSAELGYYGWENFLPICKLCEQNLFKIAALTNKQSQLRFHQHLRSSNINICVWVTGDGLWSNHSRGHADPCQRCLQRAGARKMLNLGSDRIPGVPARLCQHPLSLLSDERLLRKGLVLLGVLPGMESSPDVRMATSHKASPGQTLKPTLFSFGCHYFKSHLRVFW